MKTILSGSIFFLLVLVGAPESAQALGTYDTFDGKRLDPEKWAPDNFFGFGGILDARREVSGGEARLVLRSYAGTDSDEGGGDARSRLLFPESVGALITDIRARVQINRAKIKDCPTNVRASRILVPRIGGQWFNDGTCSSPPCFQPDGARDFAGDMFASIEIRRDVPTGDADGVTAVAQLFYCDVEPDCFDGTTLAFEELGKLSVPQEAKMRIQWDQAGNQFIFRLNNHAPIMVRYAEELNMGPPGGGYFKSIQVNANVQNCDLTGPTPPRRPVASGDVSILNVKVNDEALP